MKVTRDELEVLTGIGDALYMSADRIAAELPIYSDTINSEHIGTPKIVELLDSLVEKDLVGTDGFIPVGEACTWLTEAGVKVLKENGVK